MPAERARLRAAATARLEALRARQQQASEALARLTAELNALAGAEAELRWLLAELDAGEETEHAVGV